MESIIFYKEAVARHIKEQFTQLYHSDINNNHSETYRDCSASRDVAATGMVFFRDSIS